MEPYRIGSLTIETNAGTVLRLEHNPLLPNSFQFIFHQSFYHPAPCNLVTDSVVKQPTNTGDICPKFSVTDIYNSQAASRHGKVTDMCNLHAVHATDLRRCLCSRENNIHVWRQEMIITREVTDTDSNRKKWKEID